MNTHTFSTARALVIPRGVRVGVTFNNRRVSGTIMYRLHDKYVIRLDTGRVVRLLHERVERLHHDHNSG